MNKSQRILALKKAESSLDRSAFKIMFALVFSPGTVAQLIKRTGIVEKSISNSLVGLSMDNLIRKSDEGTYDWSQTDEQAFLEAVNQRRAKQLNSQSK